MANKTTILYSVLLCTILCSAALVSNAEDGNLLSDSSFEQQLPANEGGWNLFDESRYSSDVARSGERSLFHAGFSRTVAYPPYFVGTVSGSYQEFPAAAGSRWQLTGYGIARTALEGASAFGIVQLTFFDADDNDLGTLETAGSTTPAKISNKVDSQTPAGEWVLLDTGVATAPKGTTTVQAFTLYVDYSGSDTAQGVHFDDLTLTALE